MKVLVTGANGFLGSALVRALVADGRDEVRCLVRPGRSVASLAALQESNPAAKIEIYRGDLTSAADCLGSVSGVDVVYHAAAGTNGSAADLFRSTVVGSRNLLEAVVLSGRPRVVLISSFGVYGTALLPRGYVVDENTPLEDHPELREPYSHSKLRQELLFQEYREKHGVPLLVVRPSIIYGPGGGVAIPTRVGLRLTRFFLHLGGTNKLPLTYVDNCAEAIVLASRKTRWDGEVYNVVDDEMPTNWEYFSEYRKRVSKLRFVRLPYFATYAISWFIEWYHVRSRGQLPPFLTRYKVAWFWKRKRFDNSKIKSLGWSPRVSLAEGLDRCFSYWKQREAR